MTDYAEITIPTLYGDGTAIPALEVSAITEDVARSFTDLYGGATVTDGKGYYRHDDGRLAIEDVKIIKAFSFNGINLEDVRGIAWYLAHKLRQEAVLLNVSGNVEFVGSED